MLNGFLQIWGGAFYLLNKIFFSRKERAESDKKRKWQILAWSVYLIGLPAWIIIFVSESNWIAAALEAGGAPSMVLGLTIAIRGHGEQPKWLDYIAIVAIALGLSYSLYDFGGITVINQWLELSMVAGFLVGTYMLAKERPGGYLWFMLMNISNAILMYIQGYPWLCAQQIVSLIFVADAFFMQKQNEATFWRPAHENTGG